MTDTPISKVKILNGLILEGQTAGASKIADVTVNLYADGSWDFTDAASNVVVYEGDNAMVNLLLQLAFVGSGGLAAGTKLFGNA